MSYGASLAEAYHRAAAHVDRILKGASPAYLAVEQPTRFELVLDLRTAAALGLSIRSRCARRRPASSSDRRPP